MTTTFSISTRPFMPTSFSMPANFQLPANVFMPVKLLATTSLDFLPSTNLAVIQDITKAIFIGKQVIPVNHTIAKIYTKSTIQLDNLPFASLDKA